MARKKFCTFVSEEVLLLSWNQFYLLIMQKKYRINHDRGFVYKVPWADHENLFFLFQNNFKSFTSRLLRNLGEQLMGHFSLLFRWTRSSKSNSPRGKSWRSSPPRANGRNWTPRHAAFRSSIGYTSGRCLASVHHGQNILTTHFIFIMYRRIKIVNKV